MRDANEQVEIARETSNQIVIAKSCYKDDKSFFSGIPSDIDVGHNASEYLNWHMTGKTNAAVGNAFKNRDAKFHPNRS